MKVVILAGGLGSRLAEETALRPKPMVEIGGHPLLWHIMMGYSRHGLNEFIICLGYKGYMIKEYFSNFLLHRSDLTIDLASGSAERIPNEKVPPWKITLVDTGAESMTGGRLKRVAHLLEPGEPFCMTYGDGLSDVPIGELIAFHKAAGLEATLTAVRPPGRFGATRIEQGKVVEFEEKPSEGWVNGGFFVLEPRVIERIVDDATVWEGAPLTGLAAEHQLGAFQHQGFWQPVDTLRDKLALEALWTAGRPPWKIW